MVSRSSRAIELTGRKFGRWTVIKRAPSRTRSARWSCACECGTVRAVLGCELTRGKSSSCGCFNRELTSKRSSNHHMCKTATWRSWNAMFDRCYNSNNKSFASYGGRGISICVRWHTFDNFLEDMGICPNGLSLDRYPNFNGNYEPGNCRWATKQEQSNNRRDNRRVVLNGELLAIGVLAERHGMSRELISSRHRRGWKVEELLLPLFAQGEHR